MIECSNSIVQSIRNFILALSLSLSSHYKVLIDSASSYLVCLYSTFSLI